MVFVIPTNFEDIEKYPEDERTYIGTYGKHWEPEQFQEWIPDMENCLSRNPEDILESEKLEPFYWLIKMFMHDPKQKWTIRALNILLEHGRDY
jgi:hypothetical protein